MALPTSLASERPARCGFGRRRIRHGGAGRGRANRDGLAGRNLAGASCNPQANVNAQTNLLLLLQPPPPLVHWRHMAQIYLQPAELGPLRRAARELAVNDAVRALALRQWQWQFGRRTREHDHCEQTSAGHSIGHQTLMTHCELEAKITCRRRRCRRRRRWRRRRSQPTSRLPAQCGCRERAAPRIHLLAWAAQTRSLERQAELAIRPSGGLRECHWARARRAFPLSLSLSVACEQLPYKKLWQRAKQGEQNVMATSMQEPRQTIAGARPHLPMASCVGLPLVPACFSFSFWLLAFASCLLPLGLHALWLGFGVLSSSGCALNALVSLAEARIRSRCPRKLEPAQGSRGRALEEVAAYLRQRGRPIGDRLD